ncbi:hypothetical protein [Desulfobacter curvatus]|uniref:hypothetical protein n=1 Tax=Desulfobacter curvatus TaxID=2290 RepID=UPI00036B6B31|nr:hypothetical protein [Desulfobacter curvatus]
MKWKRGVHPLNVQQMRQLVVFALGVPLMVLLFLSCGTAESKNDQLAGAIGFLSKEKSLAKSYGSLLKEYGKDDINNYVKGIRLYAVAKAEFDGLIEQLKWNLSHGRPLEESSDFKTELNQAAEQRVAFTKFVEDVIITKEQGSKNPLAVAAVGSIPELIKALSEAGKTIWQGYSQANNRQKKEVLDSLDSAKWPDYAEIAGAGK